MVLLKIGTVIRFGTRWFIYSSDEQSYSQLIEIFYIISLKITKSYYLFSWDHGKFTYISFLSTKGLSHLCFSVKLRKEKKLDGENNLSQKVFFKIFIKDILTTCSHYKQSYRLVRKKQQHSYRHKNVHSTYKQGILDIIHNK